MNMKFHKRTNARGGFTLVELLVVISITTMLVALLLPTLAKARASARSATCASNLRQFSIFFGVYSNSARDWLPPVSYLSGSTNVSPFWFEEIMAVMGTTLASYQPDGTKELGIWRCTENTVAVRAASSKQGDPSISYAINGWGPGAVSPEYRFMGSSVNWFTQPSSLYAMWDGSNYRVEIWNNDGINSVPAGFVMGKGVRQTSYRHNLGVNMLFADGHAQILTGPLQYRGPGPGSGTFAAMYANGRVWHCR